MNDAQLLSNRYEILSLLGVGGMGSVYCARDRELDEVVALKMLRSELVSAPEMLARFRLEVKLARRVTHPNVARTFDIGDHEGNKFLTMEFVDGESLGARLSGKRAMALSLAVEIAIPICAGLAAAHAAGVVHRDLKPDNVLLGKNGAIKITDFGIARALVSAGGPLRTLGAALGTPAYMAPEQVEGAANIDARADVYALGVMLYEMLAGEVPWRGDSVFAVAAARLVTPPPDPRLVRSDVPDGAARLVLRCMARKPEERFASASEVATHLAGLTLPSAPTVAGTPIHVRSPPHADLAVKTIAVLPLRNLGVPDDDYLADGLTEDLIDTLSMTPGLRTRPRGGVMRFKGVDRDPRDVGRELGVQVVAEGSLRKVDGRLDIRVRLLSVNDGFQLWAKRFERANSEILVVGHEAAAAIAGALAVDHVAPEDAPLDTRAIDFYLRARHLYRTDWSAGAATVKLFQEALDLAPGSPMILSGYALALGRSVAFGDPGEAAVKRAREVAEQAVKAAPHLTEPHFALARLCYDAGDAAEAAREVRVALSLLTTNADALALEGRLYAECGKTKEALERSRAALKLDPQLLAAFTEVVRIHALLGLWNEADALLADVPTGKSGGVSVNWLARARFALWRRDVATANVALDELTRVSDFQRLPTVRALFTLVATGELDNLETVAAELPATASVPRSRSFEFQMRCEVTCFLRRYDDALTNLEGADASFLLDLGWLDLSPLLEPIRKSPRFLAVRQSVASRTEEVLRILEGP